MWNERERRKMMINDLNIIASLRLFLEISFFKVRVKIFLVSHMGKNYQLSDFSKLNGLNVIQHRWVSTEWSCAASDSIPLRSWEILFFNSSHLNLAWNMNDQNFESFFILWNSTSYERGRCHKINDPTQSALPSISLEK